MQTPETYIEQGLKTIKLMMDRNEYRSALIGCDEILKYDPRNRRALKLMKKITTRIEEANEQYVEQNLGKARELMRQRKWEEAIAFMAQLQQYAPQHGKLERLIEDANRELQKQHTNEQKTFIKRSEEAIETLFEGKKFGDVMQACNELVLIDPINTIAKKYLAKARAGLVEQKLAQNERIVDSGDYRAALSLYKQLLAIDPTNGKVRELAVDANIHINEENAIQYRVAINRGIVRIKKFMRDGEFEKALQSCDEVLHLDAKNFIAATLKKKITGALDKEIGETVLERLKKSQEHLAAAAQKMPDAFIRV